MPATTRRGHDIIVIGASTGGLQALEGLCRELPADLPAALFVVWHMGATSPRVLPQILRRSSALPVDFASDGEAIRAGRVYIAPPDRHMLLTAERIRLSGGARENRVRPAVDPLFRSAARIFGPRVAGIILTGHLDDGTEGMMYVKRHGGVTIAQDPQEALAPGMPTSVIEHVKPDFVLRVAQMRPLLVELARAPVTAHAQRK